MNSNAPDSKKIKVGIVGGAGYTGGELVRLILNHDQADILFVQSRSQAGKFLYSVHTDLIGLTDIKFVETVNLLDPELDAIFIALPHGESKKFLELNAIGPKVKIIDLSSDYRLKQNSKLLSSDLTRDFVYGLPELNRESIRKSDSIANPGCFATGIQLALLPLASVKKIGVVSVTGITGSTGAGQKPSATSHFSFRANNIQAYKTLSHQHIAEVEENLKALQGIHDPLKISFIPWRGDFTRGIFVSAQLLTTLTESEVLILYKKFYESHPFITVTDKAIDLKATVNTNRVLIEVAVIDGMLAIHVALDNLLKGASGQAVQNFNLMYGLPETMGLKLKGSAF